MTAAALRHVAKDELIRCLQHPLVLPHGRGWALGASLAAGALIAGGVYATMIPSSQWFGRTLVAGNDPNELALTFDDGPNANTTSALLDLLDKYSAKATFFLIGERVRRQPELTRDLVRRGHTLGNHTMTHPRLLAIGPARTRREIGECSAVIEDVAGVKLTLFRPPFGGRWPYTLSAAREAGLTPVMWNALGMDWRVPDGAAIAARVMRDVEENRRQHRASNILLHDGGHKLLGADRSATLDAVGRILRAQAGKAKFVTVDTWMREGAAKQAT
jgi:peptidoglycan/xylan/chitin deacetylase (PgdA/CDA1 family)